MKTVLVVDDELANANVVVASLEDEGYRVLTAPNGLEGLQRVKDCKPDLVISDFMMPFMDGATMAQHIRDDPMRQQVRIIIVSAMEEAVIRKRFDQYDGYMRKPFSIALLLQLVESLTT